MSQQRCEEIFTNGVFTSRCILEKNHKYKHCFPNRIMQREEPAKFEALQKRKTPYRYMLGERHLIDLKF